MKIVSFADKYSMTDAPSALPQQQPAGARYIRQPQPKHWNPLAPDSKNTKARATKRIKTLKPVPKDFFTKTTPKEIPTATCHNRRR